MKNRLILGPKDEMRLRQSPYLQARWHDWEAWDSPEANSWLSKCDPKILSKLGISHLQGRHLSQLSSGEFRKARIALALTENPGALVVVDPYGGLDAASRMALQQALASLPQIEVQESQNQGRSLSGQMPAGPWLDPQAPEVLCELKQGQIRYGEKIVFHDLNFKLARGERWRLAGPNGAGKSSLLALLLADHPQAYSNELWLFGRRRGTGESIWEIKARIGSYSPELHAHFPAECSVSDCLASGFFDSLGLFRELQGFQKERLQAFLAAFGFEEHRSENFASLSLPRQRLLLILRAVIKSPALLVLDEPCQGLSEEDRQWMLSLFQGLFTTPEGGIIYVSHRDDEIPLGITDTLSLA